MPRWPAEFTDTVVFLYRTREEAERGESFGGTGLLVGLGWESVPNKSHLYAITNYHVAISGAASVIRLNTLDGKSECVETEPTEWFWHEGHDVAVHRIDWQRSTNQNTLWDFKCFEFTHMDLDADTIRKYNLGIGDEVVSAGRFVDLSGRQRNEPMLRSGCISLLGPTVIRTNTPWGSEPCHVVEMRSRTGFSGSPIYVYIPIIASRMVDTEIQVDPWKFHGPWLLGIQSGQYPFVGDGAPPDEKAFGTSMAAVVPCSAVSDLLLRDKRVIQERRNREAQEPSEPNEI